MITIYHANAPFDSKLIQDQQVFKGTENFVIGEFLQDGIDQFKLFLRGD